GPDPGWPRRRRHTSRPTAGCAGEGSPGAPWLPDPPTQRSWRLPRLHRATRRLLSRLLGRQADPLDVAAAGEPVLHHPDRLRVVVHEQEAAAELEAGGSGSAAARKEVQDRILLGRGSRHDPPKDAQRL